MPAIPRGAIAAADGIVCDRALKQLEASLGETAAERRRHHSEAVFHPMKKVRAEIDHSVRNYKDRLVINTTD